MPLPWLIGAAVVAAAAAVVKAVTDDDSPSSTPSPTSGEEERRKQEREAKRQRERDGLRTQLANLKKNRLAEVRELLARSAQALEKPPGKAIGLTTPRFENALMAGSPATSAYAQELGAVLALSEHAEASCSAEERDEFLVNLRALENLYQPLEMTAAEQQDRAAMTESATRLEQLRQLEQQLEQDR
ncbi:hypothetical protein DM292_16835 [Stutzerimonas frequens]|jgi:hypothetical protein|uniref:hypothetical protein n=1 Tax=Stutzerimonas frequens TaxID=2968969 RepID=UPI000D7D9C77|nr:hypothetical protein [Stutzerimonas frequens]AWT11754.1 hypothetical protein DM292_16835 [Stutzerimonas frequens]WRW27544.1 hypothetical protein VQ574_02095 [Stutzerimonas frequens]